MISFVGFDPLPGPNLITISEMSPSPPYVPFKHNPSEKKQKKTDISTYFENQPKFLRLQIHLRDHH